MNRTVAVAVAIALTLAGCGGAGDEEFDPSGVEDASRSVPDASPTPAGTGASSPQASPATTPTTNDVAATATVTATNFAFDTTTIEVATGDTVELVVAEGSHSLTSADAGFDTGVFADGSRTVRVDAAPGTYSYRCTLHGQMRGEVTVTP